MARLSDFQQKPATAIAQKTLESMERNAKAAGFRADWRSTKIKVPKVRGGELHFHQDVFKDADRVAKLCMALDAGNARRGAMHLALDSALNDESDGAEPEEEDEDAELDSRSEQQKHGGGCGRSYGCDAGSLGGTDEFRRSAKHGRCGCCAACTRRNAVV
jgi:hypothetical protein